MRLVHAALTAALGISGLSGCIENEPNRLAPYIAQPYRADSGGVATTTVVLLGPERAFDLRGTALELIANDGIGAVSPEPIGTIAALK